MHTVLTPPSSRSGRVSGVRQVAPVVPRLLVWTSGLVVAAGVVMGAVGAVSTGISWDEPYHVMRLHNFFDHGWFAVDWAVSGSEPAGGDSNTLVYGPVAMLLLHGLTALVGVEPWDSVAATPAAYEVRHVGVLLIGLAGTTAAAAITRILLGSWRWGLVTAATLLALPMWTGHLMFNIKDVPVATGYTQMTLALVSMVAPVRGRRSLRVAGLFAGIVLMVGTRPAMLSAVVAGLLVLTIGVAIAGRFGNARTALTEASAGVVAAATLLVLVYPNAFAHPSNLLESAQQSASFRDGRDAVYGHVPLYVLIQSPLLLLGFFAVGLLTASVFVRRGWRTDTAQATRLVLVAAQLLALPLAAIAKHSDLYNGLRQLLFASPAWAVLATIGLARALTWARANGRTRALSGVAVVALAAPTVDQALLFPYQYTYFNVALDATGAHVASDYWRTSIPELMPRIPTDGQIICGPTRAGPGDDASQKLAGRYSSDSSVDCRDDPLGPLAPAWAAEGLPHGEALDHDEFYVIIDRDHPLPKNCTRLATVDRSRHGRTIAMTYVARCRLVPSPLGAAPVAFERPVTEPMMLPELWAYAPEGWVMRESSTAIDAQNQSASLTFQVPASCAHAVCSLVLDADAPADLIAFVNDSPGETRASKTATGSIAVRLPSSISTAWVTFERASGEPLDLRVRSIRLTQSDHVGDAG